MTPKRMGQRKSNLPHKPVGEPKSPVSSMCSITLLSTAFRNNRKSAVNVTTQMNEMGTF